MVDGVRKGWMLDQLILQPGIFPTVKTVATFRPPRTKNAKIYCTHVNKSSILQAEVSSVRVEG